ncbi:MAG TPA: hypothetical protein VGK89_13040 [Candidatus Eisenbacteria bacterium]|jgi:hypothetical protein
MRARNVTWSLFAAAAAVVSGSAPARSGPWLPAPGEYYSELQAGAFSADTYHDAASHRAVLALGGVEESRSLLSYNELGWKKGRSVILGIPIQSVTRRTGRGEVDRTETGISDIQLGLRFQMADGPTAAALELDYFGPAGYNRKYLLTPSQVAWADTTLCRGLGEADSANCVRQIAPPRLGAGQQELVAAIHWGVSLKKLNGFLQVSHGYRHRGKELAGQALLSADLGFWLRPALLVAGRYRGAIDVGRGLTRADDVEEHLAGPMVVYRLDDHMDVFASSLHTAIARNALHADRFYVGVVFRQTGLNRLQGYLGGTRRP